MKSARVEYAPDYKSEPRPIKVPPPDHVHFDKRGRAYADADHLTDAELGSLATAGDERARLEREVIEAAKAKRSADKLFAATPCVETWNEGVAANGRFIEIVDALTEFKSKQK